ncbi:MAG: RidA family protein [Verrucomicrobiota bacterium]
MLDQVLANLADAKLALPEAAAAKGNYLAYTVTGKLVSLSGSLPIVDGALAYTGKVGLERDIAYGYEAAQHCVLNALAHLRIASEDFKLFSRIIHLDGFVNTVDGFSNQPKVVNGASDLLVKIFGEAGQHSRVAVSSNGLPLNATVETRLIAELK